ncbi:MAG TPA: sulfite exporter TauE/SafE family protein, partial [Candidatus Agrococcus pullicola]|nr:sulfite exporter TauE/SafE family protein [Candidatus Agrococcus pullicola]
DPSKVLPAGASMQGRASASTGLLKTLLLGASGGVAGFCVGPILGAVLTFAATSGSALAGALVMAVYGAGMVVPLVAIALAWNRLGARGRRLLRGRSFRALGRQWHSTSVVTGALLIIVGVLFWLTNGFIAVPQLVPSDVQVWLQNSASVLANPVLDAVVILAVALLALGVWFVARRGRT